MSHLQIFTRSQLHLGSLPDAPEHLTQPPSWAPPPGPDTSQQKYLSWFPNSKRCVAELLAWPALLSQCPTFQTASLTDCTAWQPPLSFRSSSPSASLLPAPRSVPVRLETLGVCQDCDRSGAGELVHAHGAPCSRSSSALPGSRVRAGLAPAALWAAGCWAKLKCTWVLVSPAQELLGTHPQGGQGEPMGVGDGRSSLESSWSSRSWSLGSRAQGTCPPKAWDCLSCVHGRSKNHSVLFWPQLLGICRAHRQKVMAALS